MSKENNSSDTHIGLALSTIEMMQSHSQDPNDPRTDVHECLSPEYDRPPQDKMSPEMEALCVFVMFVLAIAAYAVASLADQGGF